MKVSEALLHVVLPWGLKYPATRSGLVVVFLYNILFALIYQERVVRGVPDETELVLALFGAINGVLMLVFVLETFKNLLEWSLENPWRFLCVITGLLTMYGMIYWLVVSAYVPGTHTTTSGTVHIGEQSILFTSHEKNAARIDYQIERSATWVSLCKTDEGTFTRCFRTRDTVTGRPPMRAPGSWVTDSLTETDTRVLEALRQKGVIK